MSIKSLSFKKLVWIYIACICIYAFIYCFAPEESLNVDLSAVKAFYFSVTTITTLGYGEIHPTSDIYQLITSSQALLGLVIFGFLINAAWSAYVDKIELESEKRIKRLSEQENNKKLKAYSNALSWVFNNMRNSFFEITTPVEQREERANEFNEDFKEKDLIGMFDISLSYRNGFKTSIESFYENEEILVSELKYILSNFDLSSHNKLQQAIVDYLGNYFSDLSKGTLLLHSKNSPHGNDIKTIREALKKHEDGDQFKETFSATILNPILIFSITLKHKHSLFNEIKNGLQGLE
jgi:hypothetical protein